MELGGPFFVLSLIAMSMVGWIVTSWIRAKHGYPLTDDWGKTITRSPDADRQQALLAAENEKLKNMVVRLEDRISVLERIATDAPSRLDREIERLR